MNVQKNKITIQDIADTVGVSKTTVSRYLNGKYDFMSESTRKKIEEAISATNFRPNKFAKSLKTSRSDLIGLIIPEAASTMTPYLISSICDTCALHSRKVIVISTHNDIQREKQFIQSILDQQIDGIITATGCNTEFYEKIDRTICPVVQIDRVSPFSCLDFVAVNHKQGITDVLNHLLARGFRKIVFLLRKSRNNQGTFSVREQAAKEFFEQRKNQEVLFCKKLIDDTEINQIAVFNALFQESFPSENDPPTAFFIADEKLTIPVVSNFFRLGLSFSDRFAISCYDTMHFANSISEHIVSIEQPLSKMGFLASDLLIKKIDKTSPDIDRNNQIYINCHIKY